MTQSADIACPTYEDICTFCQEATGEVDRLREFGIDQNPAAFILHETSRFVVVPCIGALTDWYVLVVPRRHVLSAGWLSADERRELRILLDDVAGRLAQRSGFGTVIFEHGSYSFRDKGGACHDHAHIHVVATARSVNEYVEHVSSSIELERCADWLDAAAKMVDYESRSYLAIEASCDSWIAPAGHAPSGFFRKSLMEWLGEDPAQHDWLVFPQVQRLRNLVASGL